MSKKRLLTLRCITLALFSILLSALPASSQYFGQNKVRYKSYDFKVLKTEHFDIHYYDEHAEAAVEFGRMAERWYTRLRNLLDHDLSTRQPIILYASHTDFRGTTVLPDYISEGTGGVTEGVRRRIIMPLAGPLSDTDHVLGHELVHAFQFDIVTRREPIGGSGNSESPDLPLWFMEGMAEYLSVGAADPQTAMWMRDAVKREELPTLEKLNDTRYFPYRWGQSFWAYVAGQYGDEIVGRILKAAWRARTPEAAISSVLETDTEKLSEEWHQALIESFDPVLKVTVPAADQARLLIGGTKPSEDMYVGPVLSPDGKNVAFYSQKSLYSIEIYMADAETGKIRRKLTKTALDPHFDSLQFINSAGTWSPDGKKFAFGGVRNGRAEISIYDAVRNNISKRYPLRDVADVFGMTWSPDGESIAFSAMAKGYTDLFMLDLSQGNSRRLTDDLYTDLHPAWSPDGKAIAFSTDRRTFNLAQLSWGQLELALIDPATSEVRPLSGFPSGKHIGAQWSADSLSLYFISDRDGIPNIYRLTLADGNISQLTNLQTGVSGISIWSPALSVAEKADRLVFGAYVNDNYNLYMMEGKSALSGIEPGTAVSALNAGLLPPQQRSSDRVQTLLRDPKTGLAGSERFEKTKYRPRLSLDYIAPPAVSVGMSNFGTMVGGGIALYWSDLLGYHNLMTAFQTATTTEGGNFLNNLSGIAYYQNQKSRWNWGFLGGQVPYLTGSYGRSYGFLNGEPIVLDQTVRFWEISRQATAVLARPLSRAQRIEFSGGFQRISYDAEAVLDAYSAVTGEYLGQQKYEFPTPDPLNLGTANAALVYDTSIFGGTSPILGQSYRFETGIAAGTLMYSTLLADYRRYVKLAGPLTLAGRVLHYGRYGKDSEDERMGDLTIGYPSLVRGYQPESFSINECTVAADQSLSCPTYDRLFGSRIAVANAELRLPLLGFLGVIPSRAFPPVESALFYDAGMAFRSKDQAIALGVPRRPVSSYGATMRFNVLGFFIAQLSYVHANDRPQRRWGWEFSIVPGF